MSVRDRDAAAAWYGKVLGLVPVEAFAVWATPEGPLTLRDADDTVHLALFETGGDPAFIAALGTSGPGFAAWKEHLEQEGVALRLADHDLALSLYFDDPDGNGFEITTYEHEEARRLLAG